MSRPRALVIGGSLGGLFAANLLRTIGWDAVVFERARGDLAGRGAGLGARDELFEVMRRVGAGVGNAALGDAVGARVNSRQCRDILGNIVHEVPQQAIATAWDRVYQPMREALPDEFYRSGMQLERHEASGDRVAAIFADGSREEGDLLIGADGLYSTVRAQAFPEEKPVYSGYVAWRFVVTEKDIPEALHDQAFSRMIFSFPRGELAFAIPMPPSDDGARQTKHRAQCVWFRPVDFATELPLLCTDAKGVRHGVSIPPPLIRSDLIAELREIAGATLAPHLAAFVRGAEQPILQPVFDLASKHMVRGRVALVGDSASVVRPHVATGVTKAALDAQALADALLANDDIDAALARYDRERPPFGARLVERGRWIGADIGRDKPAVELTPEPGKRLDALLRGYGAAGVIEGEPVLPARGRP